MLAASEEVKARYLMPVARGEAMFSYALSEPEAGSDAAAMRTKAVRTDSGYVLNGVKRWITNAGVSKYYTVMAVTDPVGGRERDLRVSACGVAGWPGPVAVGCGRVRGPVHVQIADRVWGGADGVYNRSLRQSTPVSSRYTDAWTACLIMDLGCQVHPVKLMIRDRGSNYPHLFLLGDHEQQAQNVVDRFDRISWPGRDRLYRVYGVEALGAHKPNCVRWNVLSELSRLVRGRRACAHVRSRGFLTARYRHGYVAEAVVQK
jgi:hypothetical protein